MLGRRWPRPVWADRADCHRAARTENDERRVGGAVARLRRERSADDRPDHGTQSLHDVDQAKDEAVAKAGASRTGRSA